MNPALQAPGLSLQLAYSRMETADVGEVVAAEAELHAFPWSATNFHDCLHSGYPAWLARINGEFVAYAILMLAVDEAHLLDISVLKPWQGRGIAAEFMDFLCHRMKEEGMVSMLLEVRPSNAAALRLYENMGFSRIGLRKGYYPAVQGREDAIVMRREL